MIRVTIKEHFIDIPDEKYYGKLDISENGIVLDGRKLAATNCAVEFRRIDESGNTVFALPYCGASGTGGMGRPLTENEIERLGLNI